MAQVDVAVDVCVVGGGMAGVCAALAAARHGASVALIQDRPVLGGNASSEIRMHVCGADHHDPVWRETGILEELRIEALLHNDRHNPHQLDYALYDAARRQPGLQLHLNAQVTECKVDGGRVISCTARELTSDRTIRFVSRFFVDASGDGALAYYAGAEYRRGREGRGEFEESLAPEAADSFTLGHSILFQTEDVGRPVPFVRPPWALEFETDADLPHRGHGGAFGYWWVEWGGTLDTITDSEQIKDELIAAALGVWDHVKNKGDHGFENYALSWLGFLPGRRESRRFIGDHILTQDDLTSGRRFPDQVAYGGWPIDTHPPLGFRGPEPPCTQTALEKPFGIPLRSCYCRDFDNLFIAGRIISATHIAFASTRIMATCALTGHAVGVAVAVGIRHSATVREIADDHVGEVQQSLLADGAYLLGIASAAPDDLARCASVTASSSAGPDYLPESVIDGISHPYPSHAHCWRSDPTRGLPAWVELSWPDPVEVGFVQLVFDTGFDSRLTLTQDARFRESMGPVPRAQTVKDAAIQVRAPGSQDWTDVAQVSGNYQRLVRLSFPTVRATALRIRVDSTWGDESACILEVRCSNVA